MKTHKKFEELEESTNFEQGIGEKNSNMFYNYNFFSEVENFHLNPMNAIFLSMSFRSQFQQTFEKCSKKLDRF